MLSTTPLKQIMQMRKSVRKYNPETKIPRETIMRLLQDATSAPSSSNMYHGAFLSLMIRKFRRISTSFHLIKSKSKQPLPLLLSLEI